MENRSRPRIRYTCKIRSVQEVSLGTPLTCIVALLTVAKGNNGTQDPRECRAQPII